MYIYIDHRWGACYSTHNDHFIFAEAKSVTINRMQNNLQEWEKQLKNILEKKSKNGKGTGGGSQNLSVVY